MNGKTVTQGEGEAAVRSCHGFGTILAILTFAAALVSGCSPGVEMRISSNGIANPPAQPVSILAEAKSSAGLQSAYSLVARDLAARGFVTAENAPLHLVVTADARDAVLALNAGLAKLSEARKKKPFQNCAGKEYRVGVTVTRIADGLEIYRGQAAEHHCKMRFDEALPDLVKAALADFGTPRGRYTILRKVKE
jgi:hypothetical protein